LFINPEAAMRRIDNAFVRLCERDRQTEAARHLSGCAAKGEPQYREQIPLSFQDTPGLV